MKQNKYDKRSSPQEKISSLRAFNMLIETLFELRAQNSNAIITELSHEGKKGPPLIKRREERMYGFRRRRRDASDP